MFDDENTTENIFLVISNWIFLNFSLGIKSRKGKIITFSFEFSIIFSSSYSNLIYNMKHLKKSRDKKNEGLMKKTSNVGTIFAGKV